jgi:hypothetical protein
VHPQVVQVIPFVASLAAAAIVYLAVSWGLNLFQLWGAGDRLVRFVGPEEDEGDEIEIGSEVYKIRLAFSRFGLDVKGKEAAALLATRVLFGAVLALAIWWGGFPPLTVIGGPVVGLLAVGSFIEGAWGKMRREIEAETPTFLSRIVGTVQTEPNVLRTLEDVAETLNPEGPLQAWLHRLVAQLSGGGRPAFQAMLDEAEAISPSLGLAIFEIGRMWETGGEGYTHAFARAAENLLGILDSRAQATAKAAGAKSAIRVVLGALIVVTMVMLRNPTLAPSMHSPLVQITYLGIAVWVTIGWFQINNMIEEAIQ